MTVPPPPPFSLSEFVWIWNYLQGLGTPALHRRIADWLDENYRRGENRMLLMAFRGSGKSTLVGLYCAWRLKLDPNLRIVILAAEQSLAVKMARNVKRVIERHPLLAGLAPRRPEQWAADRFTVARSLELRDPSVLARGLGANMTGGRADLAICDDVEVPNTCGSAAGRAELRERLGEIDYVLTPGGAQLYVGTPHSRFTIYATDPADASGREAPFLRGFARLSLPAVTADGAAAWPERFDLQALAALRRRHGPAKFRSQMLLQPVEARDARLQPERLRRYDREPVREERNGRSMLLLEGRELVSASCWWDPAFGAPDGGDGSVLACLYTDLDGRYWLHRVCYLQADGGPERDHARRQCDAVADLAAAHDMPSVTVEVNGVGKFLPGLLRTVFRSRGLAIPVVEAHARRPKDIRILEALDAVLAAGNLMAHRSVWDSPFIEEMRNWRPGAAGPDDGLDAVAGCLSAEPIRLRPDSIRAPRPRPGWRRGIATHRADTRFQV